ncbi:MAG: sigma-70 family RNA polymerase sigma factor [Bacteroidota bacterium]
MKEPEPELEILSAFHREKDRLLGFIQQRVPDWEEAEDVLQEVFTRFVDQFGTPEKIENTTAWLFRVARNRITDLYRKQRPDSFSKIEKGELLSLSEILPDPSTHPEMIYERNMILETLEDALEELPANQREVFVMHEFDGMSFKEIAKETGVSLNTLLSRKRYAILYLRERLYELYEELG